MITPQTDVILLKVPLEINDTNQLTFENKQAQYNYFYSLPKVEFEGDFTYQKKDGTIRVPALIDDIMSYNYVMYRNEAYNDKWFYAFIDNMEWKSDEVTDVSIRTDVWQTWQFDLTYKPTFIDREHTNDDTIGINTQPETLELGDFVINGNVLSLKPTTDISPYDGYFITFMVSDTAPINKVWSDFSSQYNGVFSGYVLFGVTSIADAQKMVERYVSDNKQGAITNIFYAPKTVYGTWTTMILDTLPSGSVTIYFPQSTDSAITINENTQIPQLGTIDGYTPKNNKLFTYPYTSLYVTNNVGGNAEYRFEDFKDNTPKFDLCGIVTTGCDIKLIPKDYKHVDGKNEAYGLKMSKLPVCSWNTDSYAVWLAQNELNMRVSLTRNALKTIAGVASKNVEMIGSGIGSYAGDVLNSLSERYIATHVPDEVHGDPNSSNYNFSAKLFIEFRRMCVRREYAEVIDNYFSVLGYATNKVKLPNVTGRRNWNFVKTIGCYIEGDIPQRDLEEIKSMFNRGITFWHNTATFADYSQNNDII